jgi:UDP-N-acetylmuramoyl-tripeptide--D-alanyl-D-alanine ligase
MAGAPLMLTAAMIATATGGTVVSGDPQTVAKGFSIDSRTLQPGDLFFAIVAARDGHEFVEAALDRGAAGAIVHRPVSTAGVSAAGSDAERPTAEPVIIEVPDTTTALQDLGRYVRRKVGATVVAITGSAGKTTTKETIADFLSGKYRVTRNKGNLNNHLGLPLSLLELRHGADVAVMELGMNHAGEIRLLVGIAEPEVRVWTNVGDAHIGYFESRDAIADAKGEILESANATDVLICNADDPLVMARVPAFAGRRITFGLAATADVRAESVEDLGLDGTRLTLQTPAGSADVHTPLLGRGNVSNLLAAAAVATHLGIRVQDIADRAARLRPAAHRGAVTRLPSGITIVDDSYNSSPTALKRVLEVIAREPHATRKAAVLGEMLELGEHSLQLHRECGEAAGKAQLDRLIVVGGDAAQALAEAAVAAGMAPDDVTWTASSGAASDLIVPWLNDGDVLLVKGSRGIKTDAVVDRVLAECA